VIPQGLGQHQGTLAVGISGGQGDKGLVGHCGQMDTKSRVSFSKLLSQ
jgi:hypothetical protein